MVHTNEGDEAAFHISDSYFSIKIPSGGHITTRYFFCYVHEIFSGRGVIMGLSAADNSDGEGFRVNEWMNHYICQRQCFTFIFIQLEKKYHGICGESFYQNMYRQPSFSQAMFFANEYILIERNVPHGVRSGNAISSTKAIAFRGL